MLVDPDEHPSFYKLLFKEDFVDKILMPPAFIKENKSMLAKTCLLKTDEGVFWEAKIVREKCGYFICEGEWPQFLEYHKLKLGNILLFFLIDKSTFKVLPYKQIRFRNLIGRQVFEELSSSSKEEEEDEGEGEGEVEVEVVVKVEEEGEGEGEGEGEENYHARESNDLSSDSKGGESPRYSLSGMAPKQVLERSGKATPSKRSRLVDQPPNSDEEWKAPQTRTKKQKAAPEQVALSSSTSEKVGCAVAPTNDSRNSRPAHDSPSASQSQERTNTHNGGQPNQSSPVESSSKDSGSDNASEGGGSRQSTNNADKHREAEMRRKSTEELDRVRWSVVGAKEKYMEGCQIVNGNPRRSITEEKEISTKGLDSYPEILDRLKFQKWEFLTRPPGRYCPTLVREFFAAYGATLNATRTGPKSQQDLLERVTVRGVSVDISAEAINRYYMGDAYVPVDSAAYVEKHFDRENQRPWLAPIIARSTPVWLTLTSAPIFKRDLKLQAKFWWSMLICRIWPTKSDNALTIDRAVVLAAIMEKMHIDIGRLLVVDMKDRALQTATSLPFPCLITALCNQAGVPALPREDNYIQAKQVVDITKMRDEMSLTVRRRRCIDLSRGHSY